jgi:hypothetical protein
LHFSFSPLPRILLHCVSVPSPTCRTPDSWLRHGSGLKKLALRFCGFPYLQNPPRCQGERKSWWRHGTGLKKLALRFCGFSYLQNHTRMARREIIMMAAWLRSNKACFALLWLLLPAEPHHDGKDKENHAWRHGSHLKKLALRFCGFSYLHNLTRRARREKIMVAACGSGLKQPVLRSSGLWLRSQTACLAFLWLFLPAEPHQDGKERKNHDGSMAQVSKRLPCAWLLLPAEPHQDGKERKNHDRGVAQVSKSLPCVSMASPTCRTPPGWQGEKES